MTPWGPGEPLAARMSAYFVPAGQLQYSTQSRASSGVPVPRLTVIMGVQPIFRQSLTYSSVPKWLVSVLCQASSRTAGRESRGPMASKSS